MNFQNTTEAITFGRNATKEERNQLKVQRSKFLEEVYVLEKNGDLDGAMVAAVSAQFCREALCANTCLEFADYVKTT